MLRSLDYARNDTNNKGREMKEEIFKIISNENIAKDTFELNLEGDASSIRRAGQFVNIKIDGFFLRRPISICDYTDKSMTLIYKVVGEGTKAISEMKPNQELKILIPLGNGFDTSFSGNSPLLVAGGVGVPPIYLLAKKLLKEGKSPSVILGFNSKDELFYEEKFKTLGINPIITTVDASYGIKGFVTDAITDIEYSYLYTCGPSPMLKALHEKSNTSGQFSFEARMACGFGACMGCSIKTRDSYKRICKEGPVLFKEEILW